MKRRQLVRASIAGGVLFGIGGGAIWLSESLSGDNLTIEAALSRLNLLASVNLTHTGEWNSQQIFTHCAQSIEYSMFGFPRHQSDLFKNTVGQLAFSIFSAKGKMSHGLSDPIPGAPSLASGGNSKIALSRLQKSLIEFNQYAGSLAPHFAYGELTKKEYEIAHVMHLNNHLQEITSWQSDQRDA